MVFFSLENSKLLQSLLIGIAPEGVTTTRNFTKIGEIHASVQPVILRPISFILQVGAINLLSPELFFF